MNIQNATVFVGSTADMMDEFGDAYEAGTGKGANPQQGMNIQNATVFVGSTADMMDEFGDAYEAQSRTVP
ncbi:hypothetical protein vBKpnAMK4_00514 [Klebsiella phage vB_Kpn_AM_K4]